MSISFAEAVTNLEQILRLARGKIDPASLHEAEDFLAYSSQRRQRGIEHSVIAFAGGTGAGKSSLLNSVLGFDVAPVAPTRPTTSEPQAVCSSPAPELLDWLDVRRRHIEPTLAKTLGVDSNASASSVIMLDLPDIDSTNNHNREIARRLSQKVDVLIWVLDPQKYADAIIHDDYLAHMRHHAEVTIVVLNQADTLAERIQADVVADAQRILHSHGIDVPVLATSTRIGLGIVELRERIAQIVQERNVAYAHLCAQLKNISDVLEASAADGIWQFLDQLPDRQSVLVDPLLGAIGGKQLEKILYESCVYRGNSSTTSIFTRWLWRAKVDPLKRFRLVKDNVDGADVWPDESVTVEAITELIGVDRSYQARYEMSVDEFITQVVEKMPRLWAHSIMQSHHRRAMAVLETAGDVLQRVSFPLRKVPLWWRLGNIAQWFLGVGAVVGALWLILLNFGHLIQIQLIDPPAVDFGGVVRIGLPLLVMVGAALASILVSLLSGVAHRWRARRMQKRIMRDVKQRMNEKLSVELMEPLKADLQRYLDYVELVESLRSVKVK
ncbi:GTPase Era involved in 16S rRNA processing [Arcanobacterium pluranimalium]|uniref:GTPase n=1 Tax=Arcanobacterium pluranimalium TaxID=108028 RepID=UPI001957910E|nr:GTPase [Arcanobacterium pluranimalium]MBM7825456.1 GTPase Era involved in 16S rRNA processing [Arcanobacterium pluranimalium]